MAAAHEEDVQIEEGEEDDDSVDHDIVHEPLSPEDAHRSVYADVRGAHMLKYTEFYQYFALLGLLTGVGLMSINNIGNDVSCPMYTTSTIPP